MGRAVNPPQPRRACLLALAQDIGLRAVFLACLHKLMARLGAEMRHIDDGGRIIGQKRDLRARIERAHPLAQAQDGQGAQQPAGIDDLAHAAEIGAMFQPVHKVVTECADDAGRVMG